MKNIFDTHAHYTCKEFDNDRTDILLSVKEYGVRRIMLASTDLEDSLKAVRLAESFEDYIYCAVGVHPECVENVPEDYLDRLEKLTESEKVKAIGEIGLDYHYEGFSRKNQIRIFEEQLMLAERLQLPVIIHSRDATEDCMNLLRIHKPRGVLHCFSGSAQTALEAVSLGLYISFTGVITFKNARRSAESLKAVPLDRLLLETDCPYMAPEPWRGRRCDSSMISSTAEKAAQIKGISTQNILDITYENGCRLFGTNN